jgi:hypothetical protein
MKAILLNVGIVIISFIVSWFALAGIAYVGDKYQIPFLNSWSMMHLSIFFLFPVVTFVAFVSIRKIFNIFYQKNVIAEGKISHTTSKQAILSFIFSCLGFVPFLSLAGIIFGHRALKEIKTSSNIRGSGFAVTGLVFGYLWLIWSFYFSYLMLSLLFAIKTGEIK